MPRSPFMLLPNATGRPGSSTPRPSLPPSSPDEVFSNFDPFAKEPEEPIDLSEIFRLLGNTMSVHSPSNLPGQFATRNPIPGLGMFGLEGNPSLPQQNQQVSRDMLLRAMNEARDTQDFDRLRNIRGFLERRDTDTRSLEERMRQQRLELQNTAETTAEPEKKSPRQALIDVLNQQ